MRHLYRGGCPDETQPNSRDAGCPACAAMKRKPLTDEQIIGLRKASSTSLPLAPWEDSLRFARAIERAHGITGDSA